VSIFDVALRSNAEWRDGRRTLRFGSRWHAQADSLGARREGRWRWSELMQLRLMVPIGRRSGDVAIARLLAAILLCFGSSAAPLSAQASRWPAPTITYMPGARGRLAGPIVSRRGNDLLVRDETTHDLSLVTLTTATAITQHGGFLNLDRKARDATMLIVGLVIVVKGAGGDRGDLVAREISFHESSLQTATHISAGDVDLGLRALAAPKTRILNLDAYSTRVMATINFAIGSASLDPRAKRALDDAVSKGRGLAGYIIQIVGFADSTGSIDANQRLSVERADAVAAYLTQAHAVPRARIVSPKGVGASHPAAGNATAAGRAQNRRVEVRVMVNGGARPPTAS
jgi:outer membrane protein OmpA-like peptidoglycan-associated protein